MSDDEKRTMPKLLTFRELKDHGVTLGRRQIDRLEADGKFPKRVPITSWSVAWVTTEIDAWIDAKIAARAEGLTLGSGRGKKGPRAKRSPSASHA